MILTLALLAFGAFSSLDAPAADLLETKLAHQWQRYEAARLRSTQAGAASQALSRDEWEKLLALPPQESWTAEDWSALRSRQRARIDAARAQARADSTLDLDQVRSQDKAREFCATLPKGGMLHVHPWGTLGRETVRKILEQIDPLIRPQSLMDALYAPGAPAILYAGELDFLKAYGPQASYDQLSKDDQKRFQELFFLPEGSHGFDRFLGIFTVVSKTVFSRPDRDPAPLMWDGFLERAAREGVQYVEISENVRAREEDLVRLERNSARAEQGFGIRARSLVAFNRMGDAVKNREALRELLALRTSPSLVGINLVNDEGANPAFEKGQPLYGLLQAARTEGRTELHASMHAGELGDPRNLRDAMLLGSERIGHGVKLVEDPVAFEYASIRHLPVEANITSNLRLKVATSAGSHPFLDFLRSGMSVSLSTDDEGMFDTDIDEECATAIRATDLSWAELVKLTENSLSTAFATEAEKQELLARHRAALQAFELSSPYRKLP